MREVLFFFTVTAISPGACLQIYPCGYSVVKMEISSTDAAEKSQPVLPCKDNSDGDAALNSREGSCGATAGRARWSLLRQVQEQAGTDLKREKHLKPHTQCLFSLLLSKVQVWTHL